jgi:hypothetical protein
MRLWSLHPRYLDSAGLVALWREALLAQKVLLGETRGYRSHPQLARFRRSSDPVALIGAYLSAVAEEAESRGYRFDRARIARSGPAERMAVTAGQIAYEWSHLLEKLARRAPSLHAEQLRPQDPEPHPLFVIRPGEIEDWERPAGARGLPST